MVPKAGIEPACPKAVDFESTASTDFATSALKSYTENEVHYTVNAFLRKTNPAEATLIAEKMPSARSGSRVIVITL
jgi:hypothetical protein